MTSSTKIIYICVALLVNSTFFTVAGFEIINNNYNGGLASLVAIAVLGHLISSSHGGKGLGDLGKLRGCLASARNNDKAPNAQAYPHNLARVHGCYGRNNIIPPARHVDMRIAPELSHFQNIQNFQPNPHLGFDTVRGFQELDNVHGKPKHQPFSDDAEFFSFDNLEFNQPRSTEPRFNQPRLNQPQPNQPRLNQPQPSQPQFNRPQPSQPRFNLPQSNQPRHSGGKPLKGHENISRKSPGCTNCKKGKKQIPDARSDADKYFTVAPYIEITI